MYPYTKETKRPKTYEIEISEVMLPNNTIVLDHVADL